MNYKMTLKNFEQFIPSHILKRGFDYYNDNLVHSVHSKNEEVTAVVEGQYTYDVFIQFDTNHKNIISNSCNCPYDQGMYCKHVAAVLYYLSDEKEDDDHYNLYEQLKDLDKDQLINLLLDIAEDDKSIVIDRMLHAEDSAQHIIDHYLNDYTHNGFIDYKDLPHVIHGFELALKQTQHLSDEKKVYQFLTILMKYIEIYQEVDDSYGSFSQLKEEVINELSQILYTISDSLIIMPYLEEFNDYMIERYELELDDMLIEVLECLIPLSKFDAVFQLFSKTILLILDTKSQNEYMKYYIDDLVDIMYQMLLFNQPEKANLWMKKYSYVNSMQLRIIDQAFDRKDYATIINLCEDMINKDDGNLIKWYIFLVRVYQEQNEVDKMKVYMKILISQGNDEFLDSYKRLFTPNEWKIELDSIIQKLKKQKFIPPLYEKLLISEHLDAEMFWYVKNNPYKVFQLHKYFDDSTRLEIIPIFKSEIINQIKSGSSMKDYLHKIHYINLYFQSYPIDLVIELIAELRILFKKRKAFLEVLSQFEKKNMIVYKKSLTTSD
jgi:uncharacterized Zn finger protein